LFADSSEAIATVGAIGTAIEMGMQSAQGFGWRETDDTHGHSMIAHLHNNHP